MTGEPVGRCFGPVVDDRTRVLILGSLPGQRSLAAGQYYAHPQNQFWRLIGTVIDEDLTSIDYDARLRVLARHKVGLWDTVAEARRVGSLDSALESIAPNDLGALVARLPNLRLIAFNGQKADSIGRRQLIHVPAMATAVLPSSSPAYTLAFHRKLAVWQDILGPVVHSAGQANSA